MKKCLNNRVEIFVYKNVYFNTQNVSLFPLKIKTLALVYCSHSGDPLGGHIGFRGKAPGKKSPPQVILQLNILNYHKMKKKVRDPPEIVGLSVV